MSEKKPEIIYIALHNMQNLENEGLQGSFSTIKKHVTGGGTAYILKQTHDKEVQDLKAEIERLKMWDADK